MTAESRHLTLDDTRTSDSVLSRISILWRQYIRNAKRSQFPNGRSGPLDKEDKKEDEYVFLP